MDYRNIQITVFKFGLTHKLVMESRASIFSVTLKKMQDGALYISDDQRRYEGNYTCTARNIEGSDQITHPLQVQVAPSAPHLHVTSTSTTSPHLQWVEGDTGGNAIRGYSLNYEHEPGEWEEKTLPRSATSYKLEDLSCGSEYRLYLMTYNSVGSGPPSDTVKASTDG